MAYAVELRHITKRFGQFTANDDISFGVEQGQIHSLAGENGAGKTTLMNIIYGLYTPTSGELLINGKPVHFTSSKDAIHMGIGMVHQHFMLVPKMTVAENIIAGEETGSKWFLDRKTAEKRIAELSERYGMKIDPKEKVGNLSVTMQQRVEILKVLYRNAKILIFDEPTAVLTPQEIDEFCEILLKLKAQGNTILFISHKLAEVMKISDKVTVIRRGRVTGTFGTADITSEELAKSMVGREIVLGGAEREQTSDGHLVLDIQNVTCVKNKTIWKIDSLSLGVKAGEIMGVAGVDGNGQEELAAMISGQEENWTGDILLNGKSIKGRKIHEILDQGLGYIPEDRHKDGLVLEFSIAENMILGLHKRQEFAENGMILKEGAIHDTSDKLKEQFDIRCTGVEEPAASLSGGNQQKIVIARAVYRDPHLILAVQPTRGLDVGAIEYIHQVLVNERNKGKAVLLFSLELDEILALSDRIAVIYKGQIAGIVDAKTTTKEELGLMMLGQKTATEEVNVG